MTDKDLTPEAVERCAECDCREGGIYCTWIGPSPQIKALIAERDALKAELAEAVGVLRQIRNMKPHHAGQTPNEYHMQDRARAYLDGLTEYVRADLCDPTQDERVRALVEAAKDFEVIRAMLRAGADAVSKKEKDT